MSLLRASPLPISGVGSLPFRSFEQAWRFVANYCPVFPFVPEIVSSETVGIPFLFRFLPNAGRVGEARADVANQNQSSAHAYQSNVGTADLLSTSEFKALFPSAMRLKDQLIGPGTAALILENEDALNWELLLAAYEFYLPSRVARLHDYALPLVFFLDEPMLDRALADPNYRMGIANVLENIRTLGASSGVHYCGDNFSPAMFDLPIDWLSIDLTTPARVSRLLSTPGAYRFLSSLQGLLLGLIPPIWTQSAGQHVCGEPFKSLLGAVSDGAASPSCGLALQSEERAHESFEMLRALTAQLAANQNPETDSE